MISTPDYCRFCISTWATPKTPTGENYLPGLTQELNILHAILGLAGENLEIQLATTLDEALDSNSEEIYKELGDLLYYTVMLFHHLNLQLPAPILPSGSPTETLENLINQAKRKIFYRIPTDLLYPALDWWNSFYYIIEPKFEYIKELNYQKLSIRYPDGEFTSHHANEKLDS